MATSSTDLYRCKQDTQLNYGDLLISDRLVSTQVGTYGEVCHATIGKLACAAKVYYCSNARVKDIVRVEFELQALTVFQHPNLVQCFFTVWDIKKGVPIQLMELLDESLTQYLSRQHSCIPYHVKVNLCKDTAMALAYLHLNGIVHGNLTGNNILILNEIRAKVTDFWTMSIQKHGEKTDVTKIPEKRPYMAPERMKNTKDVSIKSDSYSYGIVMTFIDTQSAPVPLQQNVNPPDHSALAKIAHSCLSKEPDSRPNFDEICSHLEELIDTKYAASLEETKSMGIQNMQAQFEYQLNDMSIEKMELKSKLKIMQDKVNLLIKQNGNLRIKLMENESKHVPEVDESSSKDIPAVASTDTQQVIDGIIPIDLLQISDIIAGQGESAILYKGNWQSQPVAFKQLRYHQNRPQKWMANFRHEAAVLSQLSHSNVVKIFGITTPQDSVGIIVELMNSTLYETLFNSKEKKALSCTKKNRIVRNVSTGLEYLHSHDIYHGRLSSLNVLVSGDNIYKIGNFGPKCSQKNFTSYHIVEDESESYFYSAPEVLRKEIMSCKNYKKADVYSLAMVAFEVLYQKHCFDKDIPKKQLMGMVVQSHVRPNLDCLQGTPDSTKDLLIKCWDNDPSVRTTTTDFVSTWKKCQTL